MEEWTQWRDLARRVPASLLSIADVARTEIPMRIVQAISRLADGIFLMRMHRFGYEINEHGWPLGGPPPAWYGAGAILDDVRRELFHLRVRHAGVGNVFALYSVHLGIFPADPEWQTSLRWNRHHADAVDHSATALKNLRSAAARARASRHAFLVSQTFPLLSPGRNAWLTAALRHSRVAVRDAIVALHDSRRMSGVVTLEFFDAWMVLMSADVRVVPPNRLLRGRAPPRI